VVAVVAAVAVAAPAASADESKIQNAKCKKNGKGNGPSLPSTFEFSPQGP
jgi:hypothetical protein